MNGLRSLVDLLELVDIYQAFRSRKTPNDDIQSALNVLCTGQPIWFTENSANDNARNRAFELRLGALFARAGYLPRFFPNDILLDPSSGQPGFAIECKRMGSPATLETNLDKAALQLNRTQSTFPDHKRIVALSVDRIHNPHARQIPSHIHATPVSPPHAAQASAHEYVLANKALLDGVADKHVHAVIVVYSVHSFVPRPNDLVLVSNRVTALALRHLPNPTFPPPWLEYLSASLQSISKPTSTTAVVSIAQ